MLSEFRLTPWGVSAFTLGMLAATLLMPLSLMLPYVDRPQALDPERAVQVAFWTGVLIALSATCMVASIVAASVELFRGLFQQRAGLLGWFICILPAACSVIAAWAWVGSLPWW